MFAQSSYSSPALNFGPFAAVSPMAANHFQPMMLMNLMQSFMELMMTGMMGQLLNSNSATGAFGAGHSPMFGGGCGCGQSGLNSFLGHNGNSAPSFGGSFNGNSAAPSGSPRSSGSSGGPTSSGPQAPGVNPMLDKARSMLGLHEGRDTAAINAVTKKSGINAATTPWCAAFAMNLLKDHGVLNLDGLSNRNYCPTIEKWATDKGIYGKPGQYQPKPGDAVLFDWQKDGTSDHIGIVEKVENGQVYVIEGNSSNSVKRNSYPLNSAKIDGYVVTGTRSK